MNRKKRKSLIDSLVTATLLGTSTQGHALSDSERLEKLEKTLLRMEQRLEKSEEENKSLRRELSRSGAKGRKDNQHAASEESGGPAIHNPGLSGYSTSKPATQPELKALDNKVKLIERKLEVEKEISENNRKSAAKVEAGQNGFKISSADGDWQLRLRGFLQLDSEIFLNDQLPPGQGVGWDNTLGLNGAPITYYPNGLASDRFLVRRARLQFAGTIAKYLDFLIAPDFGGGQARLFDAWADFHYYQPLSFAFGKMKGPQDLERLQNATNLLFNERAYPTQLSANRQIGAMLHGELEGPGFDTKYISNISHTQELFSYQLGVFNGSFDNQPVQNSDSTSFDNKEYAGRIFAHPFRHVDFEPIQRLGIGFAGNYTDFNQTLGLANSPLQSQGQSNILTYSSGIIVPGTRYSNTTQTIGVITGNGGSPTPGTPPDPKTVTLPSVTTVYGGAMLNGGQYHIAPQGYWYWGPFGILTDWTMTQQELAVTRNTVTTVQSQADVNAQATGTLTTGTTGLPGYRAITTTTHSTQPVPLPSTAQTNTAWQVALSYVLTGEENTYWAIKPLKSFDPFNGQWGAWQLALRWQELNIDQSTFTNFGSAANPLYLYADPRSSVSHAQTWGLGINWFMNSNVKLMADYESTQFTGGAVDFNGKVANRPDEQVFFTRVQFWY